MGGGGHVIRFTRDVFLQMGLLLNVYTKCNSHHMIYFCFYDCSGVHEDIITILVAKVLKKQRRVPSGLSRISQRRARQP